MKKFLPLFLEMIIFFIVILVIYSPLKKHVFSRVKANKWVVLGITIVLFFGLSFLSIIMDPIIGTSIWTYISSAVTVIMMLWFMDLAFPMKQKAVTKPKAKPKRVRHPNPRKK